MFHKLKWNGNGPSSAERRFNGVLLVSVMYDRPLNNTDCWNYTESDMSGQLHACMAVWKEINEEDDDGKGCESVLTQ